LNHPHLATVHGFEQSGHTRAIVMELVGQDGDDAVPSMSENTR
jgi:hypothetical protein